MKKDIQISVIITTYNRSDKLRLALEGLVKQSLDKERFEVWVIDNNSTDDTEVVAREFQDTLDLYYYVETAQGLGHTRDTGFRKAGGAYVAFLDDDAIPSEGWLEAIYENILEHEPDCLCGPIYPYYTSEKPSWFKDEYEIRSLGGEWHIVPERTTHSGSNMTWKRTVLFDLGGFNVDLGVRGDRFIPGEDSDLFYRYWEAYKGKVVYDPNIKVLHWTPAFKMQLGYVLKRYMAVGIVAAKLNRSKGLFKEIIRALQLMFEIPAALSLFLFTRVRHKAVENWAVEEGRRVVVRMGELITMLGFEPGVEQY
ncbi:MAG: glycosyltransferase family 2 protein [Anaerolineales bacterium]|jgi:glycosyltransferase involved in cell wall biosynthesis